VSIAVDLPFIIGFKKLIYSRVKVLTRITLQLMKPRFSSTTSDADCMLLSILKRTACYT